MKGSLSLSFRPTSALFFARHSSTSQAGYTGGENYTAPDLDDVIVGLSDSPSFVEVLRSKLKGATPKPAGDVNGNTHNSPLLLALGSHIFQQVTKLGIEVSSLSFPGCCMRSLHFSTGAWDRPKKHANMRFVDVDKRSVNSFVLHVQRRHQEHIQHN